MSYFAFDTQAALLTHGQNVPGVVYGTINEAKLSTTHNELCQEIAQNGRYGDFYLKSLTMVSTT